jgi:glycosyltransferase involved in cell wall biosynthesis
MRTLSDRVLEAPNVADTALFAEALAPGPEDPAITALPHPRIVFTGAVVGTKLDLELLAAVARRRPDWAFALVGPVGAGDPGTDVSALQGLPNVHLLGPRPYAGLPAVLRAADAALIPYAVNDLTRSVFPMKVYEYLAAGRPVVSTPLLSLEGVEGLAFADEPASFVEAVEGALSQGDPDAPARRRRIAEAHSWERRLDEIGALVRECEGR